MNKSFMSGRLTRDPMLSETNSGISLCTFSIACKRPYPSADGSYESDFFNVVTFRGVAENCAKYLRKGRRVYLIGYMQNREVEGRDGKKHVRTELVANEAEFIDYEASEWHTGTQAAEKPINQAPPAEEEKPSEQLTLMDDSDLPF